MNTNLLLSQQKNILQNSLTKEEILIKSLIEEIYDAEQKISEINNDKNNNIQNEFYLNSKKILELKDLQERFISRINSLNNKFQTEFNLKNEEILLQKKKINDLDILLNEYKQKIESLNINEFKIPLLKYTVEKNINNGIISEEEIKEIYIKNKNNDELTNNKLKEIKHELEIYKASETVILNNKKELTNNLDKLTENIKMLKEEKNSINVELFDIISYKETLECINKNNLLILNKSLKGINTEEIAIEPIEVLFYNELIIIEINKVTNLLYNELSNSLGFVLNDLNIKKNLNKSSNKNGIYFPKSQSKETNTIEIYDKKKINYKENWSNKNKSLSNSCIIYDNNSLEKNSFEILIEKELNIFIKEKKEINIYNLLDKIALIIIEQIKKSDIEIPFGFNNKLILYLSYFFKILYYDKIIKDKIKFVNKEYKSIKKEYKKAKEFANNELLKLENKFNEINLKKSESENNLNLIKNTKINNKDNMNLSDTEQIYIQICSEINTVLKQKDDIKKNIILYENDINNIKIKKNNEILYDSNYLS